MCRAGGPRCKGNGRTDAPSKTTSTTPNAVPSREQADQLAAGLTRQTDGLGQPLDERGRRFFALRESGYTGPIDQDGYPDTTSDGAATLRRMATDRGEQPTW